MSSKLQNPLSEGVQMELLPAIPETLFAHIREASEQLKEIFV